MNQPPATAVVDPSMMSLSVEMPSLVGPDDSSRDHESKGTFSNFPHNAFVLDDKVGVSKLFTPPGDQNGAFKAQVDARMMPDASGILVSEK